MSFQELIESKEVSYCSAVKAVKCGVVDSFVTVVRRICQRYDMDLSELLHAMSMLLYVFLSDEQKQAEV